MTDQSADASRWRARCTPIPATSLIILLHRQVVPWVSRAGVAVVHRPNNMLYLP